MKREILLLALFTPFVHADPLVWRFDGTTSSPSEYSNASISGLTFELRIFLDTDLPAIANANLADVFYAGPHSAEVEIQGLGVLPVNNFANVQYFKVAGQVTAVQFNQPAFSDITFPAPISNDPLHLSAIPPTTPNANDNTLESGVFGPGGLQLFGPISSFSATLVDVSVPETGSTQLLLAGALAVLSAYKRRA